MHNYLIINIFNPHSFLNNFARFYKKDSGCPYGIPQSYPLWDFYLESHPNVHLSIKIPIVYLRIGIVSV